MRSLKGSFLASTGESTAVASAKRAALGDFNDSDLETDVDVEVSDEARGRVSIVNAGFFLWLSDMSSERMCAIRLM